MQTYKEAAQVSAIVGADLKTAYVHLEELERFLEADSSHLLSLGMNKHVDEVHSVITIIQYAFAAIEIAQARAQDIINEVGALNA